MKQKIQVIEDRFITLCDRCGTEIVNKENMWKVGAFESGSVKGKIGQWCSPECCDKFFGIKPENPSLKERIMKHAEEHYWDTFEPNKNIILAHVRGLLDNFI